MKKNIYLLLSVLCGIAVGSYFTKQKMNKRILTEKSMAQKHLDLYLMMNQWVKTKQEYKSILSYLNENGYNKIAIYGMNYVGNTLLDELKKSQIFVAYGIDRRANEIYADIDVFLPNEPLEEVDCIIVTAISFFEEIKKELESRVNCPVISLQDILYEI